MGFNIRHYPKDLHFLVDKLVTEGSHQFYNMYIRGVDCWIGSDVTQESEKFIESFMKKYTTSDEVFYEIEP